MSFVKPRYWERKKEGKGRVREKKQIDMGYRHRVMRERERSRAIS